MDGLRHLFERCGYEVYNEGKFYKVSVKMLDKNPLIEKRQSMKMVNRLRSIRKIMDFEEVPSGMINKFGNKLSETGIIPGIDASIIDGKISYFGNDGKEIHSAIMFKKPENGVISNILLYSDNDSVFTAMTGTLLVAAAESAYKSYPAKTSLLFWISGKETKKLLDEFFPDAIPVTEVVEMELRM